MIKRLRDVRENIENIVKNPVQRGRETGFRCLDELYSRKLGSFTVWHGSPAHGKSELIFEMLINGAIKFGEISYIYSPETGSVEEIMIELAHKYLQKQIVLHHPLNPVATELEMHQALEWVDHHFIIVDGDEESYTFSKICDEVLEFEKVNGIKISNIMAEPYNEIDRDPDDYNERDDLYMEAFLTRVRRFSKKYKKHTDLSFHPGRQTKVTTDKITYYPMPQAREAAGGQGGFRKAMTWINMWRPPNGLKNEHGQPYLPNEVLINIEKAKPKYISYRGTCSLFFDPNKNRYYEKIFNIPCFAYEHITRRDELFAESSQQGLLPLEEVMTPEKSNVNPSDLPF